MMGNVYVFYHLEVIRSALHNFWHYYPGLFMSFAIRYTRSLISLFEWQIRRVRLNGKKRMMLATFFTWYKIIIFSQSESVLFSKSESALQAELRYLNILKRWFVVFIWRVNIFLCLPSQTEHHPHCVQSELIEFCRRTGIFYQAYSSLGTTTSNNPVRWSGWRGLWELSLHSVALGHHTIV